MRAWSIDRFDLAALTLRDIPDPTPGPGEALLAVRALSLNFRDLLVIRGQYNPKLPLPATPISDAAGEVLAVGPGVTRVRPGDRVMTHFLTGWIDGPFRGDYPATTLGLPRAGLAAERVALPADALLPLPSGYSFAEAATLPIAALTAWSALVTAGGLDPAGSNSGRTVLTLGTGGVSIFAVQIAAALGARVIITSSSDEKIERARRLGAAAGVNYRTQPNWDRAVLDLTNGEGADVTVENGGAATLDQSIRATRAGGVVALLGALTGLKGEVNLAPILMRRMRIMGIMVDSRAQFERLSKFLGQHAIRPVIDRAFAFEALPAALAHLAAGAHFGKIVVDVSPSPNAV